MDRSLRFPLLLVASLALHTWAVFALPATRPARLSVQRGHFRVALRAIASPSSQPDASHPQAKQRTSKNVAPAVAAQPAVVRLDSPPPLRARLRAQEDVRPSEPADADSGAVDAPPVPWTDNPAPTYPEQARRDGEQGIVRLKLLVLVDGRVGRVATLASSGYDLLDEAARQAAGRYRFEPASRAGKPVENEVVVPFEFRLQRNRWASDR